MSPVAIGEPLQVFKRARLYLIADFQCLALRFNSILFTVLPVRALPKFPTFAIDTKRQIAMLVNSDLTSHYRFSFLAPKNIAISSSTMALTEVFSSNAMC